MATDSQMADLAGVLATLGSINRKVNANAIASLTFILYDIVTCFPEEVELIWKSRWTLPKVVYIALRYYAPLWLMYQCIIHLTPGTQLSAFTCKTFPPLQAIGPLVLWILLDVVMILRVKALYGHSKKVQYVLAATWISAAAVIIPITIYCFLLSNPIPAPPPFSSVAGCLVLSVDWNKMKVAKAAVIAFLILNMFYLGMTVYKFIQSIRSLKQVRTKSVLSVFLAEGLAYFAVSLGANVADIVFGAGSISLFAYVDLAQFWTASVYSYAGCHLILHLRAHTTRRTQATTFIDASEMQYQYTHNETFELAPSAISPTSLDISRTSISSNSTYVRDGRV